MKTIIMKCNCKHDFQDSVHGVGNRVHNLSPKDSNGSQKAFCTVCSGSGRAAKHASKASPPTTNRPFKTVGAKFAETKPVAV